MKNKLTIFLMLLTILFIGNISIQAQGQIEVSSSVSGVITDGGTDNLGTSVDVGNSIYCYLHSHGNSNFGFNHNKFFRYRSTK